MLASKPSTQACQQMVKDQTLVMTDLAHHDLPRFDATTPKVLETSEPLPASMSAEEEDGVAAGGQVHQCHMQATSGEVLILSGDSRASDHAADASDADVQNTSQSVYADHTAKP